MKLSFAELARQIHQVTSNYTAIFNKLMIESEQAHIKIIEESGWTPQEYFDAINKSRADLHKYF